ncbi:class I SAM-dependent methyltransferase [Kouleothrix sp.]|uniref:class I SAM-dependent methyltransferase n=1 Tax=Kouleothrix sp. TaxID=2779161 RepID=UPI00391B9432
MTALYASKTRPAEADQLPDYWRMLHAYHCSRQDELRAIVATLPLTPSARVLDLASGDGCYAGWLAERAGQVIGADASRAYIELARQRLAARPRAASVAFQACDAAALPFADNTFDLAWCAQSFYSLPDPNTALREMIRVTRPGGTVAVLENDTLHQIILPWPAWLELAVRQAQLEALADRHPGAELAKFYVGRNLRGVFQQHGLEACELRSYSVDRHAPLSADELLFLRGYLADLRERAWPRLAPNARAELDWLIQPDSPGYLLRRPDLHLAHLELLALGRKPRTYGAAPSD